MTRTWSAVLARLGVPTGDGRIIDPAGITSRDLPMPLMWQERTGEGHSGAVTVGSIDSIQFTNGMVVGEGRLLELFPERDRLMELINTGVVGPSVDLADDLEYSMDDQERIVITRASIGGATLVPIEAFADVSIHMTGVSEGEEEMPYLYASAVPEPLPPLDWFRQPDLDRLTPLTISDTGRVFGHIAGWGTCHVGLPGCVTPPSSMSGYTYFHVAEQETVEGPVLPVGTLVAGPRHADAQAAFQAAQSHYDVPGAAVARVMAGEDEHGIWVAGWMLPGASEEAKGVFRSSPVSGDWRRIGGSLEMIAVCSVNAPGFPVPRARVAFSNGAQRTLIGSFGITPVEGTEVSVKASSRIDPRAKWAWRMAEGQGHGVR